MPRLLIVLSLLVPLAAGCGKGTEKKALPTTVQGTLPQSTTTAQPTAKGDPTAGKKLFDANGCAGCHTFTPANAKGTTGPDLDKLAADAQKANQGPVDVYAARSIKDPGAYVVPGYQNIMPSFSQLSNQQVADLVAFLTTSS